LRHKVNMHSSQMCQGPNIYIGWLLFSDCLNPPQAFLPAPLCRPFSIRVVQLYS
jgi:hypothetical protein